MPEFLPSEVHRLRQMAEREKSGERLPPRPPRSVRPRCVATTYAGVQCKAKAVWDRKTDAPLDGRCRIHSTHREIQDEYWRWRRERTRLRKERRAAEGK